MSDNPAAKFANLMKKKEGGKDHPHASTSLATDLTLSSHVPFGVPTRIPQLDLSIGKPGLPIGRIVELYGFEASGKTTAGLHIIAAAQAMGGLGVFIDTEKHFDRVRAEKCGVDTTNLIVTECDSIESIFRTIDLGLDNLDKIELEAPLVFVVDSITAVISESEYKKKIGEEYRIGQDARAIRHGLRKLNTDISRRNVLCIFINHSITNIGAMFGKKSLSAGGHALKFYSSIRVNFAFVSNLYEGEKDDRKRVGQTTAIRPEKNKVSGEMSEFKITLGDHGFCIYEGLFEVLKKLGEIEQVNKQTWFYKPTESQITRKEWPELVDRLGGPWKMYEEFLKSAQSRGLIVPYGG